MAQRYCNLRQEIKLIMESRHQNVAFLSYENWLNDLAFLTDISKHLSDQNVKQQGKSQVVNMLLEHICAFEKKLGLLQDQLSGTSLTHVTCLADRKIEFVDLDSTNYAASVQRLHD